MKPMTSGGAVGDLRTVPTGDGRTLAYLDAGPGDGLPVIYLHGIPSAAAEWRMWASPELLAEWGVRLLAVDRPGVGGSAFDPHRTVASTGDDLSGLAELLGLDRFVALGYSGGAGYALALALSSPACAGVALMAGMAPFAPGLTDGLNPQSIRFLGMARQTWSPFGLAYLGTTALWHRAPERFVENALASFGPADREVFADPVVHNAMMSTSGSPRGQRRDVALAISPWGLDLARIGVPVHIWQGDADRNVSLAMAESLADALPTARLQVLPGEGHISLPVRHAAQVLAELRDAVV